MISTRADQIFDTLQLMATVGMTWWVSSTILCATILGGVWAKRKDLRGFRPWTQHGFFTLIAVFVLTIVGFGVLMIVAISNTGAELSDACSAVVNAGGCKPSDAESLRLSMQWGFSLGTTSFVAFLIAWIGVWIEITKTRLGKRSS